MEAQLRSLKLKIGQVDQDPQPNPSPPLPTPPSPYQRHPPDHEETEIPSSLESLISRTQSLLHRVKGSIVSSTTVSSSSRTIPTYQVPQQDVAVDRSKIVKHQDSCQQYPFHVNRDVKLRESEFGLRDGVYKLPDGDLNDIELLLNGVPDAYPTEISYDDEEIEKIMKQAGKAPSQLEYPTLYAINQKIMDKLKGIDKLQIKLSRFLVYSAKFGIRMDGAFFIIRPPRSYPLTDTYSETHRVDLPEIRKVQFLGMKKDGMKQFFVGEVELSKVLSVPIKIDDDMIRMWMSGGNPIEIELYSYLAKPGIRSAGVYTEPIIFGRTKIPMEGILGTTFLDAIVNMDIEADASSHSAVMNRIRALHVGQQIRDPGKKLGIISAQVSLLNSAEKIENYKKQHKPSLLYPYPANSQRDAVIVLDGKSEDARDTILSFLPEEKSKTGISFPALYKYTDSNCEDSIADLSKQQSGESVSCYSRSSQHSTISYYGVGIFQWQWLLPNFMSLFEGSIIEGFSINFKFSLRHDDSITVPFNTNCINRIQGVGLGKVIALSKGSLDCPLVELRMSTKEMSVKDDNTRIKSSTIAKSKATYPYVEGEPFSILLYDIRTLKPCVALETICFRGQDRYTIEREVFKALDELPAMFTQHSFPTLKQLSDKNSNRPNQESNIKTSDLNDQHAEIESFRDSYQSVLSEDSLSHHEASADQKDDTAAHDSGDMSISGIISCLNHSPLVEIASLEKTPLNTVVEEEILPPPAPTNALLNVSIREDSLKSPNYRNIKLVDHPHRGEIEVGSHSTAIQDFTHIWDISIHGNISDFSDPMTLGYHICYSLPAVEKFEEDNSKLTAQGTATKVSWCRDGLTKQYSSFSIWWDSECAILNSTNRHRFTLPSDFTDFDVGTTLGINPVEGLEFHLFSSDDNGNPILHSRPIAKAILSTSGLLGIFRQSCTDLLVPMSWQPMEWCDRTSFYLDDVVFKFSHRVDPVLLGIPSLPNEENRPHMSSTSLRGSLDRYRITEEDSTRERTKNGNCAIDSLTELPYKRVDAPLFIVSLDHIRHLQVDSAMVGSMLFLSLEICDGLKSKDLTKIVHFTTLQPVSDRLMYQIQFEFPCNALNSEDDYMGSVAKSSLILNAYERLPLFPSSKAFKNDNESNCEFSSYPPSNIRVTDKFLGSAVVDLSLLAIGMPVIEGWYHFLDPLQKPLGQIKVMVRLDDGNGLVGLTSHKIDPHIDRDIVEGSSFCAFSSNGALRNSSESDGLVQSVRSSRNASVIDGTRVSYQIDESLIDIKAMEYDALHQLLIDLDETKQRLLDGLAYRMDADDSHTSNSAGNDEINSFPFHFDNRATSIRTDFLEDVMDLQFLPEESNVLTTDVDEVDVVPTYEKTEYRTHERKYSSSFESFVSSCQSFQDISRGSDQDVRYSFPITHAINQDAIFCTNHSLQSADIIDRPESSHSDQDTGDDSREGRIHYLTSASLSGPIDQAEKDSLHTISDEILGHYGVEDIECELPSKTNSDRYLDDVSFGVIDPESCSADRFQKISTDEKDMFLNVEACQEDQAESVGLNDLQHSSLYDEEYHIVPKNDEAPSSGLMDEVAQSDKSESSRSRTSEYEGDVQSLTDSGEVSLSRCSDEPFGLATAGLIETDDAAYVWEVPDAETGGVTRNPLLPHDTCFSNDDLLCSGPEQLQRRDSIDKIESMDSSGQESNAACVENELAFVLGIPSTADGDQKDNEGIDECSESIFSSPSVNPDIYTGTELKTFSQNLSPSVSFLQNQSPPENLALKKTEFDILHDSLQSMQSQLLKSKSRQPITVKKLPGRQKAFVDAETERVSKIMMGVFHTTS